MMRSFLLLTLLLMTGCEVSSNVEGCRGGWVEFTCEYPDRRRNYESVVIAKPRGPPIKSTAKNQWEAIGRFTLYHDTYNKKLKVVINGLKPQDSGDYKCSFYQRPDFSHKRRGQEVEVEIVKNRCQEPFSQTLNKKAGTTITCDYPYEKSSVKFFCKENNSHCDEILSTSSSQQPQERFTLKNTNSGFSISIRNVSPSDAGVYWCGVDKANYRAARKKITLEVNGGSELTVIIAAVVCVALLLLMFTMVICIIYKRMKNSKNTRHGDSQNNQEDRTYEEIQDAPQTKDSGTALNTIYATANFPTDPSSASHHYSHISPQRGSVEVSGADTYAAVRDNDQHPIYSTANHPSRLPEDTVKEPQQL